MSWGQFFKSVVTGLIPLLPEIYVFFKTRFNEAKKG